MCVCLIQHVYCTCILCIVNVTHCKALCALVRKGALEMLVIIIINIIIIIIFDAIPALAEPSIGVFSGAVFKSKIFGKTVSGDNRY